MIRNSASFLRDFFGAGKVFRTGGDEFNVLLPGVTEEEFQNLSVRFLEELHKSPLNMAVGVEADKKMYQDKAAYYIQHDRRKKK